jgi:hypothetical protein
MSHEVDGLGQYEPRGQVNVLELKFPISDSQGTDIACVVLLLWNWNENSNSTDANMTMTALLQYSDPYDKINVAIPVSLILYACFGISHN